MIIALPKPIAEIFRITPDMLSPLDDVHPRGGNDMGSHSISQRAPAAMSISTISR